MTAGLRRLRRERRDDRGITLAELLVTMTLLAIMSAIIVSFMSTISRSFTEDAAATDSTNVAASGMNELTRVIRSGTELRLTGGGTVNAPVFIAATGNDVTLYAYIDTNSATPAPVKVRFSIDSQRRLVETRWNATTTTTPWEFVAVATPSYSRIVARSIPVGSVPMFTYLDVLGHVLTPASGTFTTTELKTIAAVQIELTVQADGTDRANPVTIRNAVSLPNLGISRVGPPT